MMSKVWGSDQNRWTPWPSAAASGRCVGRTDTDPLILGRDEWVALLPNTHDLARRSSARGVSLEELASYLFVLATGGCTMNGRCLAQQVGTELVDIKMTVRDWASALGLVREGLGVTIVPESSLPQDLKGLRVLSLAPAIFREFGLVRSSAGMAYPMVDTLWTHFREEAQA